MACNCPEGYINVADECVKTTIIADIECPAGCTTIITEDGNAICNCTDSLDPTEVKVETPVYFDNTNFFKDVSWTVAYKPTEGAWNSYFTFFPDYSISHQEHFQIGYNWGAHKGTSWNHTLQNDSFGVFMGEKHGFSIEFPISSENVNKILNSLSINVESRRYINHFDYSTHKDIGATELFIYNSTNNTGYLILHPQESLVKDRKYPYLEDGKQHISTTFVDGKQTTNYLYNRVIDQKNNIPAFKRDENNIFKDIDPRAVKFGGKKVLEKLRGDVFMVNLSNTKDSLYQILIKNLISNETIIG